MLKSLIRKYFFLTFSSFCTLLIFSFFMIHIFFGDRSLWKIFELNKDISIANKELDELLVNKSKISSEIDLLRLGKLDSDFLYEISQKMLGLIQTDQIVIKIPK
jgi:cell division protein FtsB